MGRGARRRDPPVDARRPVGRVVVEVEAGQAGREHGLEGVPQVAGAGRLLGPARHGGAERHEAGAEPGQVFGAAAQPLAARPLAANERAQVVPLDQRAPHHEEAGAGRPAELVEGRAEGVDAEGDRADGRPAEELGGVRVERHARLARELRHLAQVVEDARLVVGGHDRDQAGVRPQRRREVGGVDGPEARARPPDGEHGELAEPLGGEAPAAGEQRAVLGGARHDVREPPRLRGVAADGARDDVAVALRGAAREDGGVAGRPAELEGALDGDQLPEVGQHAARLARAGVVGGRVAPVAPRAEGPDRLLRHEGRRVVVQVDGRGGLHYSY